MRVSLNWSLWANGVNHSLMVRQPAWYLRLLQWGIYCYTVSDYMVCSAVFPFRIKGLTWGVKRGALRSIPGRQNRSQKLDVDINVEITKAVAAQVQRWGFVRCLAAGVSAAVTQSCQTQHPTLSVGGESSDVYYSSWQYSWGSPGKA